MACGDLVPIAKAQRRRLLLERQQGPLCELRRLRCGPPRPGAQAMTDIVERLRRETDHLAIEAAATIEGLLEKGMDNLTMVAAFQVNEEQRAEIDRLRATINAQAAALTHAEKLLYQSGLHLGDAHRKIAQRADLRDAGIMR